MNSCQEIEHHKYTSTRIFPDKNIIDRADLMWLTVQEDKLSSILFTRYTWERKLYTLPAFLSIWIKNFLPFFTCCLHPNCIVFLKKKWPELLTPFVQNRHLPIQFWIYLLNWCFKQYWRTFGVDSEAKKLHWLDWSIWKHFPEIFRNSIIWHAWFKIIQTFVEEGTISKLPLQKSLTFMDV